jgi:hypothetical protein
MEKKKQKHNSPHYYSCSEMNFLEDNVKGISLKELTDKFNQKFGLNQTMASISTFKVKHGLKSGMNYGLKNLEKRFEKGNIPNFTKPLFSEYKKDWNVYIKVKQPNVWVLKHRYLYEKEYGKIPKGYNVIFADGDKTNFDLDNLVLVDKKLLFIMSTKRLYFNNPELTKTGINIAKMILKLNTRRRS